MSFILAANWKMNKGPQEGKAFYSEFLQYDIAESTRVLFFVPSVCAPVSSEFLNNSSYSWGPQIFTPQAKAHSPERLLLK